MVSLKESVTINHWSRTCVYCDPCNHQIFMFQINFLQSLTSQFETTNLKRQFLCDMQTSQSSKYTWKILWLIGNITYMCIPDKMRSWQLTTFPHCLELHFRWPGVNFFRSQKTCLTSSDTDHRPDPMQPNPTDWLIRNSQDVDFDGHGWTLWGWEFCKNWIQESLRKVQQHPLFEQTPSSLVAKNPHI